MPVDPDTLDAAINKIKERRGFLNIKKGSEQPFLDRIPVKSPGIMRITKGGIPLGRLVRFWGGPSSFKTRYALEIAKESIELRTHKYLEGLKVVLYDIEKQWESEYVSKLGIPVDSIYVAETDIIEDISHEVQKLLPSAHLHILDSCSEAKSQDRLAKEAGDWDIGLNIRVWEKAWEYIMNKLDKQENTIIAIDHATQNMKTKREKAKGGKEIEHHSSLSMHFKQTSWLYYDDEGMLQTEDKLKEKGILGIGGQKEADGIELLVEVNKSRCCPPFKKTHMRYDFHTYQYDHTFELMEGALYFDKNGGIAHRTKQPAIAQRTSAKGGWHTLPDGSKIQGERQLRQLIDADEQLRSMIYKAMMAGQ